MLIIGSVLQFRAPVGALVPSITHLVPNCHCQLGLVVWLKEGCHHLTVRGRRRRVGEIDHGLQRSHVTLFWIRRTLEVYILIFNIRACHMHNYKVNKQMRDTLQVGGRPASEE